MTNLKYFAKYLSISLSLFVYLSSDIQAKPIVDVKNVNNYIDSVRHGKSRLIESCIDGNCLLFPHEDAHLIGFKGTDDQWRSFFQNCEHFSHLNNLTLGTQVALSLLTVGLVSKAGLLIRGSTLLTGLAYTGAEASVNQFQSPYPHVNEDELSMTTSRVRAALKDGVGNFLQHKETLITVTQTLNSCAKDFIKNFTVLNYKDKQHEFAQNRAKAKKEISSSPTDFHHINKKIDYKLSNDDKSSQDKIFDEIEEYLN